MIKQFYFKQFSLEFVHTIFDYKHLKDQPILFQRIDFFLFTHS